MNIETNIRSLSITCRKPEPFHRVKSNQNEFQRDNEYSPTDHYIRYHIMCLEPWILIPKLNSNMPSIICATNHALNFTSYGSSKI